MSKLRKFPTKYKCQNEIGKYDEGNPNYGVSQTECGEPAIIRCNACRKYFCADCWIDHLEMSVVTEGGVIASKQNNRHGRVNIVCEVAGGH